MLGLVSYFELAAMSAERHVRLFKKGRNQAIRIARKLELTGSEVPVRKDGDRLVIEPVKRQSLLALLATWTSLDEKFPDVDRKLRPADDVTL